jgi:hippurate hydrolase
MVTALQSFVARRAPPFESVVVSICEFHAGSAHNVIPHSAQFTGTVRTLTPAMRDQAWAEITQMLERMAHGFGVTAAVDYQRGYPPVENDAEMTALAAEAASGLPGVASVRTDVPPTMGSEDFAYYGRERPACFLRFGQRGEAADGTPVGAMPLHHPNYDFNDAILPVGAAVFAAIAGRMLSR